MRYVFAVTFFSFIVILTSRLTDKICLEETDQEVCESVHLQCGVTVRVEDVCGNKKNVNCVCPDDMSCSLETLTCK